MPRHSQGGVVLLTFQATEIARDALLWLTGRPNDLARFLALSGAGPGDLRRRAGDPEFLGFLLDFLLESDALVLAFVAEAGLAADAPARARAALPGGGVPEWT
jgi:hypothetical protein